jgi:tRNA pseudouridine38-40 synthase
MTNIKLTIAYDGTRYLGWQKTVSGPSIEESLEKALKTILSHDVRLQAASRTDAGVHASGQIVNFICDRTVDPHQLDLWRGSLNGLLPRDISVLNLEMTLDSFHPTLDCIGKEYHYLMSTDHVQIPHERLYSWHYPADLDITAMRKETESLIGEKDFTAFCNEKKNCDYTDFVRRVDEISIEELPERRLRFIIKGNNFLYKMVRNIVGTLVYVGCRKIPVDTLPEILASGDRTRAGITAPNHGLCLHKVFYED